MYLFYVQMYKKLDNDTQLEYTVPEIEENVIGKKDAESEIVCQRDDWDQKGNQKNN